MRRDRGRWAWLAALCLAVASSGLAERLPVRSYSTSNGLPGGAVSKLFRDSKGFVWVCTGEGIARFDGQAFTTFGVEEGLPSAIVGDVLETRDGSYWLATASGLCWLPPEAVPGAGAARRPVVVRFPGDGSGVIRLLEDRSGTVWCGTVRGLYRIDREGALPMGRAVDLGLPSILWDDPIVSSLADDGRGGLWVGAGSGLYHRAADGRVERFTKTDGLPDDRIRDTCLAPDGSLWLATAHGLVHLRLDPVTLHPAGARVFTRADGLASEDVLALHLARDGRLWAGVSPGIASVDGETISSHGESQGIHGTVFALEEDAYGDLWLGGDGGLQRLTNSGLVTFDLTDGLADPVIGTILEDRSGRLVVGQIARRSVVVSQRNGRRFEPILVQKGPRTNPGWGWNQSLLQDHLGEWWLPTGEGLFRFGSAPSAASLSSARPRHVYTTEDGLPVNEAFVVFEDSRGDIWFSMASPVTNGLARWRRETGRVEVFPDGDGLPPRRTFLPTAFAEGGSGTLWIAFNRGCVARFREGRFDLLGAAEGVPQGWITALLVDKAGRVWIAGGVGGLGVIDEPEVAKPSVRRLTVSDGLSSNSARCLVEDAWGRVYAGTGAGVDRIEDARRVVQHLTEAEGLVPGALRTAFRDGSGAIWFGGKRGISRYTPAAPSLARPPSVLITGVRLSGVPRALPFWGSPSIELPDLPYDRNRVQIDFVSPGRRESDPARYEYRLEGAAARTEPWIRPGPGRSVDFANLAPGRYRFEVRAVTTDGASSPSPAAVQFSVLAPFWRRWWFLALAAAALAGAAGSLFRYRLRHLLEIERVRTRIAADLHDDIGASLSRIAILSEVVKRQMDGNPDTSRFLTEIADNSRQLVDSMGDIVWSIDPRRDDLKHLLARVGQFAGGTLEAQGIGWTFEIPDDPARVKLTPEQRRATFLIMKEAINNAIKHAACRSLSVRVEIEGGAVTVEVKDDGRGIEEGHAGSESSSTRRGRGLMNMRVRAKEIGGHLTITSPPSAGTVVRLEIPLRHRGHGMNVP